MITNIALRAEEAYDREVKAWCIFAPTIPDTPYRLSDYDRGLDEKPLPISRMSRNIETHLFDTLPQAQSYLRHLGFRAAVLSILMPWR